MSIANDYHAVKRQGQHASPEPAQVWQVVVTEPPASTKDLARVRTINGAGGRRGIELGEAHWVKPRTKELPSRGDIGVAILDETRQPWIVGWRE